MRKALLKLFNSHEECFIKFEKTNYNYFLIILIYNLIISNNVLNKLLQICKL